MSNERFSVGSYESSHEPGRELLLSELESVLSAEAFNQLLKDIRPQLRDFEGNHDIICVLYPDGTLKVR
jgi:hypothetical protein